MYYMFPVHCINLDIRQDRMNNILNIFSNQNYFQIKRFNAIKNKNGALGCLSSHLEIIKSNYDEPYIIVIEDDMILKENLVLTDLLYVPRVKDFDLEVRSLIQYE